MLIIVKLKRRQIDKLSDIASDIGLVSAASIILPAVLDKFDQIRVLLGLLITLAFWSYSIWLRR